MIRAQSSFFSVLSAFNYDVAILNSDVYRHSILGLNLPQTGQYKTILRKKISRLGDYGTASRFGYFTPSNQQYEFLECCLNQ